MKHFTIQKFIFGLCLFFLSGMVQSQTNIAPNAVASASTCNTGPCTTLNDLNYGTCGSQSMWISTSSPPSSTPGVNYIDFVWPSAQTFGEIHIFLAQTNARQLTGATLQRWDGSSWVTFHSYSLGQLSGICDYNVTFPPVTSPRLRITSFEMAGPGQTSNANFREIEIYSASLAPNDCGVASIDQPASVPCGGGTANVVVTIANFGTNQVIPVTVNWSVNGVLQAPSVYSTMLDTFNGVLPNTAQITLGSASITGTTEIKAWTSMPNNVLDTVNVNDTVVAMKTPPLNGNYTIDAVGSGPNNFLSFVDAADALDEFGVCGPVTFWAKSGTYVGSVNLKSISGVGAANPLAFIADTNNTAPVKLEFNVAGNSTERGGFRIEDLSYVTIDGLEMEHTVNTSYCDVLEIRNTVSNITIKNCYIHRPYYTSSLANPIYFYTSGYIASDVTIENNIIEGGYYGMYVYGNSSSRMKNIVIENNTITDAYYYGMICYYTEKPTIANNSFKTIGALSTTSSYGMSIYYSDSAEVYNNVLHSSNYGMYVYYVNEGKFYNNKVMIGDTSLNIVSGNYPMIIYYSNNCEFIHNAFISQSNAGYILYFNTGTFGTKLYNNILSKIGSGTGIYFSSPLAALEMDYNAYELDSSASGGIDYTMSLGFDTNSYYVSSPIYSNLDSLFTCSTELPARGTYMSQVPIDYEGLTRSMVGPTVGPHEYLAPGSPVLGDDFLLCGSNPVQFVVPVVSSASYLWSTGDTTNTLTITAPGTYGITVTGLTCGSGILQDEVVVGDAASIADYSTQRFWKTIAFTNLSTHGKAYHWDFGDGQTSTEESPNHLYDQNGMYNVCLTTYGDCDTATTCDSILAHNSVGINEFSGSALVSVYPNPAKDQITIVAEGMKGNMLSIEISNVAGQVVLERQLNDFNGYIKESLNVDRLVNGVYFIKVYTSDFTSTQRLVVGK